MDILVLNGPNLNLLGQREVAHYGTNRLEDIEVRLGTLAAQDGWSIDFLQSNAEHVLIERIHLAQQERTRGMICNLGAYTHTSIALRDALLAVAIPFIEVHLSKLASREEFRQRSYTADIAQGVISGLGALGYELAYRALVEQVLALQTRNQ